MIIDEKGRLFGLINVFDLFVLTALLAMVYLGISLAVALRDPSLEITAFAPEQIQKGAVTPVELNLRNARQIESGLVRLIPADFAGETFQVTPEVTKSVRNKVYFTPPPEMPPGRYTVEIELVTSDALLRTSRFVARMTDKFLNVIQPDVDRFWQLDADAFVPPGDAAGRLSAGGEYSDSSGLFSARIDSWREAGPEDLSLIGAAGVKVERGRIARLEIKVPFHRLAEFQEGYLASGSRLVLDSGEGFIPAWMTGRGRLKPELPEDRLMWDLDMLLLVFTPQQRAAVKNGARQVNESGRVLAEIVQVVGEEKTEWIAASQAQPTPTNLRVRLRLLCELKDGKLTFRGMPVEPKSILRFRFDGQEVTGTVVGEAGEGLKARLNLHFPVLERRKAENLRPGVFLLDNSSRRPVATVLRILDSGAPESPEILEQDRASLARTVSEYRQVLAQVSLDCAFRDGGLFVENQAVSADGRLSFLLFSEQVSCTVSLLEKLPPLGEKKWIEVEAEFRSIDPLLAELAQPGMKEIAEQGEPDKEITYVISNSPARLTVTGYSGISIAEHPLLRDLRCKLKIRVVQRGDLFFHRGQQLMIGSGLTFRSEKFQLSGTVTSF